MNKIGRFGEYGGQYVPEIVMNAVNELNEAYETYKNAPEFLAQLRQLYRDYANRPSLLYYAEKMTKDLGGAKVYLKREDLNHTGAHKINNVLGQILLAKRMGKKRIIAETGAGQHGVATATVAALFDMECVVYMGAEDVERQSLNAYRMELLGAKVHAVESGTRTLKDAIIVLMPVGFLTMFAALIVDRAGLNGEAMLAKLSGFPACLFFLAGALGMILMLVFAFRMDSSDPKVNWMEQTVNSLAQICFFIGLMLA